MSTLNGVKYTQKWVTEEELKVLELFKECEQVTFSKYFEETVENAKGFADLLQESEFNEGKHSTWFMSKKGKIEATAFLK